MQTPHTERAGLVAGDWRAILAVAGVALAASLAGLANNFAQDDLHLILGNARVHDVGNWWELLRSPFWPSPYSPDLYRPLTSLLLAFEYAIGAGAPVVFRVVSYLLLVAVAVQVFAFGTRLVPRNIALAVALLFAAHPVHVEAVALGVGQSELLVGLIALLMTARYLDKRRSNSLTRRDWLVLGALYLCASLVKEQGFVLPGLLVMVELIFIQGDVRPRIRQLAGGYAFLATLLALLLLLRRLVLGGEIAGSFTAEALVGLDMHGRALTMLRVVPQWVRLLVWPAHLQSDYSPQELVASSGFGQVEAFGLLLLVAMLAVGWLSRRRAPAVSFGLAWCAVTLLPVSNVLVPSGIVLAERTLFLPSIGFVVAIGGLVASLWPRIAGARPALARDLAVAWAALVALGIVRSAERQRVWRNEPYFAIRSVQDAPRSFRAQRGYGDLLFALDKPTEALEAYRRAIALSPPALAWRVRNNLARWFRTTGERAQEVVELRASLASEPAQGDIRGYLVSALLALGQYDDAAREADAALARGASVEVFAGLRSIADSAARVAAPPGSIKIDFVVGEARAAR